MNKIKKLSIISIFASCLLLIICCMGDVDNSDKNSNNTIKKDANCTSFLIQKTKKVDEDGDLYFDIFETITYKYDEFKNIIFEMLEKTTPDNTIIYKHTFDFLYNDEGKKISEVHEKDNNGDGKLDYIHSFVFEYDDNGELANRMEEYDKDANGEYEHTITYLWNNHSNGKTHKIITVFEKRIRSTLLYQYDNDGDLILKKNSAVHCFVANFLACGSSSSELNYQYKIIVGEKRIVESNDKSKSWHPYMHFDFKKSNSHKYSYDNNGYLILKESEHKKGPYDDWLPGPYSPPKEHWKNYIQYTNDSNGNKILELHERDNDVDNVIDSKSLKTYEYDYDENENITYLFFKIDNDENGIINYQHAYSYKFDDNGNKILEIYEEDKNADGKFDYRHFYRLTFDDNGNKTSEVYEKDNNGDGIVNFMYSYKYVFDEKGNKLSEIHEKDNNGDGNLDYRYAYTFKFDEKGNKLSEEYNENFHGILTYSYFLGIVLDQNENILSEIYKVDKNGDGNLDFKYYLVFEYTKNCN